MSMWLSATTLARPSTPPWLEDTCQKLVDNEPTFKTIELTHPRIDDAAAKIFAKALDENHTATTLILSCFNIVDDGAFAVGSVLGTNSSTIEKLQLRDLRNVREVKIFFQLLQKNNSVSELSLRHCSICPRGAAAIALVLEDHPQLQEFRLTDSQLTGNSLEILCQGLKANKTVQRVYFVNNELTGAHAAHHVADMLNVNGSCLRELYLCENLLGDEGVAVLARGVLACDTELHYLDVRSNGITTMGALSLQGLLVNSKYLLGLNLSNNCLSNLGVTALARGLQSSSCLLQKLDVNANEVDSSGAKAIAVMLRSNRTLQDLNLSFNNIGDEGSTAIACALAHNSTLRWLSLRRNNIGDPGAEKFAEKLPRMPGLKELLLSKNNIGPVGASALLAGLRSNVELEYLHVEDKVSEPISRQIVHWIRLNKAGRRIFRRTNSVSNSLWPQVFSRISNDPDALFHFMTEGPHVLGQQIKDEQHPDVNARDESGEAPKRKKKRSGSLNAAEL